MHISVRMYVWPRDLRLHDAMPQHLSQAPLKSARMRLELWHLLAKGPSLYCHEASFQSTAGLTVELLPDVPAGLPKPKLLDYWATLSRSLTDLEVTMDPTEEQQLLQPAYLNELTRLTRLAFNRPVDADEYVHEADGPHYALELPELEVLCLGYLWAGKLELQCPQLRRLSIEDCAVRKLYLQASLEHLHHEENALALIHESFPVTNLTGLIYLSLNGIYDSNSGVDAKCPLPARGI